MTTHTLAFDGSGIDGSGYTDITNLARDTSWLNGAMYAYTSYGIILFASSWPCGGRRGTRTSRS